MRSEQIALDAIGNEFEGFCVHLLLLQGQPACNPLRQGFARHRLGLDSCACVLQRLEPGGFLSAPVELADLDQGHGVGW